MISLNIIMPLVNQMKMVVRVKHPRYEKFVKTTSKFMAHDEKNICNVGDTVSIMETRPMSKRKCWRLVEILEKAK